MRYLTNAVITAFALSGHVGVIAQAEGEEQKEQRIEIEDVLVIGKRDDVLLVAGRRFRDTF